MNKVFVIDGNNFSDFIGFCKEFNNKVLSGKYTWRGNLDVFNDILWGGFGDIDSQENYTIVWKNSTKSKRDLSYPETVNQLNSKLETCHPSNRELVIEELRKAKMGEGSTVFDWLLRIIKQNENVTLSLE